MRIELDAISIGIENEVPESCYLSGERQILSETYLGNRSGDRKYPKLKRIRSVCQTFGRWSCKESL
jgi:hypothetical protein